VHWGFCEPKKKHFSKELMQHFIDMISSTTDQSILSIVFNYISVTLTREPHGTYLLFSVTLNHAILRVMRCADTLDPLPVVPGYCAVARAVSTSQARIVADSGVWPILIPLLGHKTSAVWDPVVQTISSLCAERDGEDYAMFIENDFFDRVLKMPSIRITSLAPMLITVAGDFPLPACCDRLITVLCEYAADPGTDRSRWMLTPLTRVAKCRGFPSRSFIVFLP
jgi:hypothetical protein